MFHSHRIAVGTSKLPRPRSSFESPSIGIPALRRVTKQGHFLVQ
jgi:hypothetical protein